jgi:hypothetical protein
LIKALKGRKVAKGFSPFQDDQIDARFKLLFFVRGLSSCSLPEVKTPGNKMDRPDGALTVKRFDKSPEGAASSKGVQPFAG